MDQPNVTEINQNSKILLMLMPFWSPLTPPLGISCLKSYLGKHGYNVKTVDVNIKTEVWAFHNRYLDLLKKYIPEAKQGNFYTAAHDVLMNHLMIHLNYHFETEYVNAIKEVILMNFFSVIDSEADQAIITLIKEVEMFYLMLQEYLIGQFESEKPDLLGVSTYSSTLAPSLFALKLGKERIPQLMTIMGGGVFADHLAADSPSFQQFTERTPYLDKIIIGEGELLFLKYLKGELPEAQRVYTLKDIGGDVFDLSAADEPDFSDFQNELYPQLTTYTSRSCPFQCNFCSETVQWGRYRKKNAADLTKELINLYHKYGSQLFFLGDSLINPIVSDLAQELAGQEISIYWDGYLRADQPVCDLENVLLWRRGGFYRARLGIESGSQRVLDLMNKKTTPTQIKAAVTALAYAGIKTTTYWVVGFPGETAADFQMTLDLVEELQGFIYEADWHPFYYYPTGQVNSDNWMRNYQRSLVYQENISDLLLIPTWKLEADPDREEIYDRVRRFGQHCQKCRIPNPYSMKEIYEADARWKSFHGNAVPALTDFKAGALIDENKRIKKLVTLDKITEDQGDFNF